ncbi:MAG TPA: asparagine synthase (glutamine-hydrolyzing), partial [Longimicrobium sp.]|nr:asparagine synthase (glutamine-hydrolyzing) [Longimicrobium sp.]
EGPPRLAREADALSPSRVVFVHRRLSILDLSQAGWQPMTTPDGRYVLVFNGEIYNFVELRRELEAAGHAFRSHSDTEVLLQAWVRWGPAAIPRLVGMFAFAVLDTVERRVVLARDPFGIKPLYYTAWSGGLAFASEIKALLELPGVSHRVNPGRLYTYLEAGWTDHGGETLFGAVHALPAAHWMQVPLDGGAPPEPVRYWRVDPERRTELSFDDAAERLRELFLDSVRLHLRSDVPVGAALSGGIDSSAIVGAIRHLEPGAELHSFSYVANDARLSEERWVDAVQRSAGTVAHKVRPVAEDLPAELDELIRVQDEPFGGTSIYAQLRVFRLAREAGIKVMLDGQGADELLAGYWPSLLARIGSLVRGGRLLAAASLAGHSARLTHVPTRSLLVSAAGVCAPEAVRAAARRARRGSAASGGHFLRREWFVERGAVEEVDPPPGSRDLLRRSLLQGLGLGLPALLRYEDRNSMANSIESRVPFLNPALAEFVLSLPEAHLVDGRGVTKSVFRRAMRGIVPDEVLDRRDKIGFATPEASWLGVLRPWVQEVLSPEALRAVPVLAGDRVQAEWREVTAGTRPYDARLWRWINLVRWSQLYGVTYE